MRFFLLAITICLLTGCDKELPTKLDESPQGVGLTKRIQLFQKEYHISQLKFLAEAQQQCSTPKQECTSIHAVKPDGSMQDCVTLVVPECSHEFANVLQWTANTASGCNDNASTFCQSFLAELDPALKLPDSSQTTYSWTLDTPYFHGSQWDYRAEVYPWAFRISMALLAMLMILPLMFAGLRYYNRKKLSKQRAKEAAESALYWKAKRQADLEQKNALELRKTARRALKTRKPYGKSAEQKKREREALEAKIKQQQAEVLAKQQEYDRLLDELIKG